MIECLYLPSLSSLSFLDRTLWFERGGMGLRWTERLDSPSFSTVGDVRDGFVGAGVLRQDKVVDEKGYRSIKALRYYDREEV